jgi:hypothetical protein
MVLRMDGRNRTRNHWFWRPALSQLSYVHRSDANENRPPGMSPASGFRSVLTPLSRSHSGDQGSIGQQVPGHADMPLASLTPYACPRFHCEIPFFPAIQGTFPHSESATVFLAGFFPARLLSLTRALRPRTSRSGKSEGFAWPQLDLTGTARRVSIVKHQNHCRPRRVTGNVTPAVRSAGRCRL